MDVLLMAAGLGTRLGEKTKEQPKAMIPLLGKPLIDYTLDAFMPLDWVDRIVIVTGFGREQVLEHLERREFSKPVVEVFNQDFRKGNFYSLLQGLTRIGSAWALTNVDHIFPRRLLDHCRSNVKDGVSAICDHDRPLLDDCMKIKLRTTPPKNQSVTGGRIEGIHKKLTSFDCGYIGMTFVASHGKELYMNAVERVLSQKNDSAYAEMVLQDIASTSTTAPAVIDASGFGWLEVDDQNDYARAKKTLLENPGFIA